MPDAKSFLSQTGQTAAFAFREYFRPLVLMAFFLKSRREQAPAGKSTCQEPKKYGS